MKLIILCFGILISTFSFSQSDSAYDMNDYLKDNGTISFYSEVIDRMFVFLKEEYKGSDVPEHIWTELESGKKEALTDITELIQQVYEDHFLKDELRSLLKFFSTETGRKINTNSELSEEDSQNRDIFFTSELGQKISGSTGSINDLIKKITQSWSEDLYKSAASKLNDKGYIKDE